MAGFFMWFLMQPTPEASYNLCSFLMVNESEKAAQGSMH